MLTLTHQRRRRTCPVIQSLQTTTSPEKLGFVHRVCVSTRTVAIAKSLVKATKRHVQMVVHRDVAKHVKTQVLAILIAAGAA
jgi:hypothetical protein